MVKGLSIATASVRFPGAVGLLIVGYTVVSIYLGLVLKFQFLREDVLEYWKDSLNWQHPFNSFHVPGYPLTIALARGLSFDSVPPIVLMRALIFIAFLVSLVLVYKLLYDSGIGRLYANLGVALFGLWPFVGLFYAAYPYADLLATAFFLGGLYQIQRSRPLAAAFLFGLLLLVHKAMWPFVGFVSIAWLYWRPNRTSRQSLLAGSVLLLPVGILWLLGAFYHDSVTWLLSGNFSKEIASRSSLPMLDGLVGTLLSKGVMGIVKSGILFGVLILSLLLIYTCSKSKMPESRYGIAIAASVLMLCLVLNQYEIWAAVRFSRLLVVPLMWSIGRGQIPVGLRRNATRIITPLMAVLLISQFIWAWYVAAVFYR